MRVYVSRACDTIRGSFWSTVLTFFYLRNRPEIEQFYILNLTSRRGSGRSVTKSGSAHLGKRQGV